MGIDDQQKYEKNERERKQLRKEMGKKLDADKIHQRVDAFEGDQFQLAFLEKEEQAGRMTVGMRNEKTEVDDSCLY